MGVVKKALSVFSPVAKLAGIGDEKSKSSPAAQAASEIETKTATEIAAEEEQKRKAALIAANAGGGASTTVGGGNANVTKKVLLGL
jgi:hypothetical protein